jgi:hypothetical protein
MAHDSIQLEFDSSQFVEALERLKSGLAVCPQSVGNSIINLFIDLSDSRQLVRLESQSAPGAVKVFLQPTRRLLDLVATVGAAEA